MEAVRPTPGKNPPVRDAERAQKFGAAAFERK
jgi:hypothetical protein